MRFGVRVGRAAADRDGALRGCEQTGGQLDQRCFAAAVRSQQARDAAAVNAGSDMIERRFRAEGF